MDDSLQPELNALAHEISDRLTSIAVISEQVVIDERRRDEVWLYSRLERIRFNAAGAQRVIKAVQRMHDTGPVEKVCVDLSELAARAATDYVERVPAYAKAQLRIDPMIQVSGDADQLSIVIENLISNALKFSSSRDYPCISVTATNSSDAIVVHVSDNGVGIAQEDTEKIFEPFVRCHPTFPGSGIGLALVRSIIHRHSGHIWARGALGFGCTVSFSLPINVQIQARR